MKNLIKNVYNWNFASMNPVLARLKISSKYQAIRSSRKKKAKVRRSTKIKKSHHRQFCALQKSRSLVQKKPGSLLLRQCNIQWLDSHWLDRISSSARFAHCVALDYEPANVNLRAVSGEACATQLSGSGARLALQTAAACAACACCLSDAYSARVSENDEMGWPAAEWKIGEYGCFAF